jgi:hypothetical protein
MDISAAQAQRSREIRTARAITDEPPLMDIHHQMAKNRK